MNLPRLLPRAGRLQLPKKQPKRRQKTRQLQQTLLRFPRVWSPTLAIWRKSSVSRTRWICLRPDTHGRTSTAPESLATSTALRPVTTGTSTTKRITIMIILLQRRCRGTNLMSFTQISSIGQRHRNSFWSQPILMSSASYGLNLDLRMKTLRSRSLTESGTGLVSMDSDVRSNEACCRFTSTSRATGIGVKERIDTVVKRTNINSTVA
mmetsp:Transcript_6930/g.16521  ORF Transcript_6930/g.16521 Transcript_6930/m.16521 type:complete len:208 (+) Transcript_6930:1613-2236(+)